MKRIVILASFHLLAPVVIFIGSFAGHKAVTGFYEETLRNPLQAAALLALFAGVIALICYVIPALFRAE